MNLFIGLLNNAIEECNDRASYLAQKADVIAEIELFYLLPFQRRWRAWFPEVIYYHVDVSIAQKYIREKIKNGEWKDDWPEMKHKILKLLNMNGEWKKDDWPEMKQKILNLLNDDINQEDKF
ncbi:hypothetical protein RirG_040830 [Rhizophagus irregularis DAOM 197198w]|uniref:Uncharacterized protein n=1 Tax=Rhizophagus irregularis (strain DAOM 197198w) TaxID=1432141 RepID=A0A015L788_RHIIW|nr:hypothetical protein RirG_040830 [Rhizophagus irregularis DAOM 197198w]